MMEGTDSYLVILSPMQTVKHFRWEDQNEDKVGKKKVYMTTSAAESKGYERVDSYNQHLDIVYQTYLLLA